MQIRSLPYILSELNYISILLPVIIESTFIRKSNIVFRLNLIQVQGFPLRRRSHSVYKENLKVGSVSFTFACDKTIQ